MINECKNTKEVKLVESRYQELVESELKLEALIQSGVDNWEGYGDAMCLLAEWEGEGE